MKERRTSLIILLIAITIWQVTAAFEALAIQVETKILWSKIAWLCTAIVPLLLLIFLNQYLEFITLKNKKWFRYLWIMPIFTIVVVFTNQWHHLFYSNVDILQKHSVVVARYDHGIFFWIYVCYAYLLLTICTAILINAVIKYSHHYKQQTLLLMMTIPFPWIGNILYLANAEAFMYRDLTPLGFGITGLLLAINLYKYNFLDLAPVARDTLVDNMDDGVVLIDRDNKLLDINPRARNILKIDDKSIGRSFYNLLDIYPELKQHLMDHEKKEFEFKIINGETRYYDVSINSISSQNNVEWGRLIVLRDISKIKETTAKIIESEKRFRTIFENTGNATCLLEKNRTISLVNKKFEELSGYKKEEIEGKLDWTIFVDENDLEKMKKYHVHRREDSDAVPTQYNFHFVDREGNVKDVLLTIDLVPGSSQSVASLLDVTDKRNLEEQLKQAQKLDSIGNLAAGIAHDFNNILTVIQGNTRLAEMKNRNGESPLKNLENIGEAAERAEKLIEKLLLFSRKQPLDFQSLNINQIIKNLYKMFERLINEDISISSELNPNLRHINGDRNNIEQVIMNIVLNARDAMPNGGQILIKTDNIKISEKEGMKQNCPAGEYIKIAIQDTGTGIEQEVLEQIFDPFFTTKNMADGTGMGLSVAYGIVKRHEGFIEVLSEAGKGTRFEIYLPSITQGKDSIKKTKTRKRKNLRGNNEYILFIEDEPEVVKITKNLLINSGYRVDAVMNAKDALQKFREDVNRYDLVLSDVVLPDMNGMEMVSKMFNMRDDIAVILCSGYTDEKSKRKMIIKKNIPFIQKPFNLEALLKNIKDALEAKNTDDSNLVNRQIK